MSHSPLLLQLVVILAAARGLGLILRYFGQPPVIGETVMTGPLLTLFQNEAASPQRVLR